MGKLYTFCSKYQVLFVRSGDIVKVRVSPSYSPELGMLLSDLRRGDAVKGFLRISPLYGREGWRGWAKSVPMRVLSQFCVATIAEGFGF